VKLVLKIEDATEAKGMAMADKTADDYLKEPYSRILIPEKKEDGRYSAEILEFPGCYAQGSTPNEAFENLEEAARSWITACLANGQEIPQPATNHGYSGKFALRLPRSLHRKASQLAHREGVSLNQLFVTAISSWLGSDDLLSRMTKNSARTQAATVSLNVGSLVYTSIHSYSPAYIGYPEIGPPISNRMALAGSTPSHMESFTWPNQLNTNLLLRK
jgi:predicted RNase H-like HicB family nuclease